LMLASPLLTGGGMLLGYRVGARHLRAADNYAGTDALKRS
jgi:hypothetical protein